VGVPMKSAVSKGGRKSMIHLKGLQQR